MSLQALGAHLEISPATVFRICVRLGLRTPKKIVIANDRCSKRELLEQELSEKFNEILKKALV